MPRWHYEIAGIALSSNVALDCINPRAGNSGLPLDVEVRSARAQPVVTDWQRLYRVDLAESPAILEVAERGEQMLVRFPGYADFIIDASRAAVTVTPTRDCPQPKLEQLLVDQVLPGMLHMRGRPTFHASAVQLADGSVIALMGPSGSGKSTLCAAACERGASLVCDDTLAVTLDARQARVLPNYASLRLWPDTVETLLGSADALPPFSPHTDKRRMDRTMGKEPFHLAHVFVLERNDADISVEPIARSAAVGVLANYVKRLHPHDAKALDAEFRFLTELTARVPVATLRYPRRWGELGRVVERLYEADDLRD